MHAIKNNISSKFVSITFVHNFDFMNLSCKLEDIVISLVAPTLHHQHPARNIIEWILYKYNLRLCMLSATPCPPLPLLFVFTVYLLEILILEMLPVGNKGNLRSASGLLIRKRPRQFCAQCNDMVSHGHFYRHVVWIKDPTTKDN